MQDASITVQQITAFMRGGSGSEHFMPIALEKAVEDLKAAIIAGGGGSGGGGVQLSDAAPAGLMTGDPADAGVGTEASRDDHVHELIDAANLTDIDDAVAAHAAIAAAHHTPGTNGWTLEGSQTTESSGTGTTVLTVSGLSIPTSKWVKVLVKGRRSAGNIQGNVASLVVNATNLGGIAVGTSNNRAEAFQMEYTMTPYTGVSPADQVMGLGTLKVAGGGGTALGPTSGATERPNATITSVSLSVTAGLGASTTFLDEMRVLSLN